MQDKTFQQAIQDLESRLINGFQGTVNHMIKHRTTVTKATSEIQDEKVRGVVKKTLIIGQIITLLGMMKDLHLLNEAQYHEFAEYLMNSFTYE